MERRFFYIITLVNLLSSIYCVISNLIEKGFVDAYVRFTLPIDMNPNFFAISIVISITFLIYELIFNSNQNLRLNIFLLIFLIATLSILTSRAAILAFIFVIFSLGIKSYKTNRWSLKTFLAGLTIVISIMSIGLYSSSWGLNRISSLLRIFNLDSREHIRFEVYDASVNLVSKKPIRGYGFSANEALIKEYDKNSYCHPYLHNYHAHNQFLQIALFGGVIVASLFAIILFLPIILHRTSWIWSEIVVVFFITFMTDNPLMDYRILLLFSAILIISVLSKFKLKKSLF